MPYATPASLLEVDLHPGRPPILHTDTPDDAPARAAGHRQALRTLATEHGAVLVRGLQPRDADHAGAVLHGLAPALITDMETFAPRRAYTPGVYFSSTWPPNQPLCMHHELSYTLRPPGLMLFACLTAPATGGATAVARPRRTAHRADAPLRTGGLAAHPHLPRRDRRPLRRGLRHRRPDRRGGLLPHQRHRIRLATRRGPAYPRSAPSRCAGPRTRPAR
ncbi:TauD/TfdA family dioxygenase [Streptomyces sp. NPDC090798]|uniref:TauD/TfdA family dioxygenase n=1 Tax=Streptomyces sp. NPDC090798 TaxID=3365968 RepID=UPI00380C0115